MATNDKRPIVIKRIKKVAGGHHGGAWKIAYADFVTAMMAFFLLMWLLGSTTKGDLKGIADYFNTPLKIAMFGGSGSGDSSSIIKGGGKDLSRSEGQVKDGEVPSDKSIINLKAASEELIRLEKLKEIEKLKELKKNIEQAIASNIKLKQFQNQILLDITTEGLRIQIVDEKNRPMFRIGRAELEPYTKEILHEIGKTLNQMPNKVSLSGHTDATPYSSDRKGFSNWDLSADRANASRRELIVGGMDENKVVRVVGLSSAVLFDKENPFNPVNRRISIIVMNKKAEEAAQRDGGTVEIDAGNAEQSNAEGMSALSASSAVVPTAVPVSGVAAPVIPPGGEGM
ncbi:MAG: flagellar motor protein MotB [Gallionellales bacterium 35-53-114]|jgi:chemotaxis protein MotB|nr:MAG: flagellar motor protein MotB [Gallionellales bacterium 35-53-114]OYZ64258.1 MAG: flagellar motor protein MotB [Gallionellales bacterium 24-53-125]OZB10434.1 MAG: flagellar motor protein MotB [Gallionellales bacterium 39-52-133]HQS57048.1 flagellar motor protein MotB [Gallionellaceae bacterium]HQS74764.1 flagellar motor protein MotB [Gallionellaceae bacterium]